MVFLELEDAKTTGVSLGWLSKLHKSWPNRRNPANQLRFVMKPCLNNRYIYHFSNEKRAPCCCLGYIEDYTTQLNRDYNKPL